MFQALKKRDYRLLFAGQAVSHIGDQFHLIALPWLVLTLTHDPVQLGLVLAAAGIPRALLMLVGGAWADRHSPRTVMLVSDLVRFALTAALTVSIVTGAVQLWMVYVLAIAFGVVSGFFMPAAEAALPRLVERDALESGNSLMMGANQLASFVGPALAGVLIALFGAVAGAVPGATPASLVGIGAAFAFDALSFLVSAGTLAFMRPVPAMCAGTDSHPLADVAQGLRYAWSSERIRWMVLLVGVANFLVAGPMFVGLPVLAQARLGGAAALGLVLSAYGLGNLGGMAAAAGLPRPSDRVFSWVVIGLMSGFALTMTALGFVGSAWVAAGLMIVTGLGNGYIAVLAMTSLQRMSAPELLGRVMSLIVLSMIGLMPVSQAVAGLVLAASPTALFAAAGAGFAALAVTTFVKRSLWTVDGAEIHRSPQSPPGRSRSLPTPAGRKPLRRRDRTRAAGIPQAQEVADMERTKQGEFAWVDLLAKDLDGQSTFYEQLFGWTREDVPTPQGPPYRMFKKDGGTVAGASQMNPQFLAEGHPTVWNTYIAVDDVDASAARAEQLGGQIIMPVQEALDIGRFVGVADPTGGPVFLWHARKPDPTMKYGEPGTLVSNSLATRDPQVAGDFFHELVGWIPELQEGGPIPYWNLPDGGIMPMPEAMPAEVPSTWVVFFGSADAAAAAARAVELGGTMLAEPSEVGGMLIFVPLSDPAGANFQLLQSLR